MKIPQILQNDLCMVFVIYSISLGIIRFDKKHIYKYQIITYW